MNLDATSVRDNISLEVILHYLRRLSNLPEHTNTIYLVDRDNCLTGILPLSRLITAPASDPAIKHAIKNPISFDCHDDEQEVAKAFADYDLISAPVVDENNCLLGRITIDDVVDVIREQAEHDIMASAGLREEEDIFAPVTQTARSRTVWLAVNLVTALLGSWVIGQFEGSIQQLVALAVLMPIVASMGGNAGTQTLTVVIRGMSVNLELGFVIAAAMIANLVMGAIAGVCIPMFLDKMKIDPALAGGVALTTVTDVVGYFSVLGLATILLL